MVARLRDNTSVAKCTCLEALSLRRLRPLKKDDRGCLAEAENSTASTTCSTMYSKGGKLESVKKSEKGVRATHPLLALLAAYRGAQEELGRRSHLHESTVWWTQTLWSLKTRSDNVECKNLYGEEVSTMEWGSL
jgi:hypothetical protein